MSGCVIGNEIKIENPDKEILSYCKEKLTLKNPDYDKKVRLGLWIGKTPKQIELFKKVDDKIILPFGCLTDIYECIKNDFVLEFKKNKVDIKGEIPLYDYQKKAVDKMEKAKNGVLVSKAGSGKTQVAIELIRRLGRRALWLTHTLDLVRQSKSRAEQYLDCKMGIVTGGKIDVGDITFATVQTMQNLDLEDYKDMFDVIIVDECHRVSGSPTRITMFYKVLNKLCARHKYGITATAHRSDGLIQSVYALLGNVIYEVDDKEVANRIIKAKIATEQTNWRLELNSEAIDTDGTIIFSKLINEICYNKNRNRQIATDIKKSKGRSCLVLSDRLNQLREIKNNVGYGVMIDGKMISKKGKEEREQAIKDMQDGKEMVLYASYNLAKEGLDIPRLERLFLASPKKDEAVIIQSVGRVERVYEGKKEAIVYDYVDKLGICANMYKCRKRVYKKNRNELI